MASNRIEELMRTASAKDRESIQNQVGVLKSVSYRIEKDHQLSSPPEVGAKPIPMAPAPTHQETPYCQRGAEKIKQALPSQDNAKAVDQGKSLDRAGAAREPDYER